MFQVTDTLTRSDYALKLLRKDKFSSDRQKKLAQREHSVMQALPSHPNILGSYYYSLQGTLATTPLAEEPIVYHLIEFAENGSLSNVLRYTGSVSEEVAAFMFLQLVHGLAEVHAAGFCHLDVKLENILLDQFFNLKLADFGSAVELADSPFYQFRKGTVGYMAPEVNHLSGGESFDAFKADMFSLGVCLHQMLFAEYPRDTGKPSSLGGFTDATITSSDDAQASPRRTPWEGTVSPACS